MCRQKIPGLVVVLEKLLHILFIGQLTSSREWVTQSNEGMAKLMSDNNRYIRMRKLAYWNFTGNRGKLVLLPTRRDAPFLSR